MKRFSSDPPQRPASAICRYLLPMALAWGFSSAALAHGDMVPQAVDTSSLPQLGAKSLESNPYDKASPARGEALRIGSSAYNQNCARCHGLEALSGGIAPDLRKFDDDCTSLADAAKKSGRLQGDGRLLRWHGTPRAHAGRPRLHAAFRRYADAGSHLGYPLLP